MKYRISAVIVILLALFSISVSAASYEYSILLSDNFTSAQYGDDLTEISQKLNMSKDDLNSYFSENGLIYLAVSHDAKTQIKLSAFNDNFSSTVNDISQLDDYALGEFANTIGENTDSSPDIITNNGRKYICVKSTRNDRGGIYTVTQYITICNNKTFYFAGYNDGDDTSNEIISSFESFSLTENQPDNSHYTGLITIIIVGVIIFSALAVIMIIGIIKSYSSNKQGSQQNENED